MHYLWLDLETTGLDPEQDAILEIGAIVTDDNLSELATRRYLLDPGYDWINEIDEHVLAMHCKSGLVHELEDPFNHFAYHELLHVEKLIVALVEPYLTDGKITLAGSGVGCFDMQVIRAQMPELAQRLNYYVIDVGCVRRFLRDICGVKLPELGAVNHRALDDVQHHLTEARQFRAWRHVEGTRTRYDLSTLVDL
jgi:oligoribonuclease